MLRIFPLIYLTVCFSHKDRVQMQRIALENERNSVRSSPFGMRCLDARYLIIGTLRF